MATDSAGDDRVLRPAEPSGRKDSHRGPIQMLGTVRGRRAGPAQPRPRAAVRRLRTLAAPRVPRKPNSARTGTTSTSSSPTSSCPGSGNSVSRMVPRHSPRTVRILMTGVYSMEEAVEAINSRPGPALPVQALAAGTAGRPGPARGPHLSARAQSREPARRTAASSTWNWRSASPTGPANWSTPTASWSSGTRCSRRWP